MEYVTWATQCHGVFLVAPSAQEGLLVALSALRPNEWCAALFASTRWQGGDSSGNRSRTGDPRRTGGCGRTLRCESLWLPVALVACSVLKIAVATTHAA